MAGICEEETTQRYIQLRNPANCKRLGGSPSQRCALRPQQALPALGVPTTFCQFPGAADSAHLLRALAKRLAKLAALSNPKSRHTLETEGVVEAVRAGHQVHPMCRSISERVPNEPRADTGPSIRLLHQ